MAKLIIVGTALILLGIFMFVITDDEVHGTNYGSNIYCCHMIQNWVGDSKKIDNTCANLTVQELKLFYKKIKQLGKRFG